MPHSPPKIVNANGGNSLAADRRQVSSNRQQRPMCSKAAKKLKSEECAGSDNSSCKQFMKANLFISTAPGCPLWGPDLILSSSWCGSLSDLWGLTLIWVPYNEWMSLLGRGESTKCSSSFPFKTKKIAHSQNGELLQLCCREVLSRDLDVAILVESTTTLFK